MSSRIDPRERAERLNEEGIQLALQGDLDLALGKFEQALNADPRCGRAHCNLGNVALQEGDPARAHASFERALELEPEHIQALWGRGVAQRTLREFAAALDDFRRVLRLENENDAGVRSAAERHAEELALLCALSQPPPRDGSAALPLGAELQRELDSSLGKLRHGPLEGVRNELDSLLARAPGQPRLLAHRAAIHVKLGDAERATADCLRALHADPTDPVAHASRAAILRALQDPRGAVEAASRALELGLATAGVYAERGFARRDLEQLDGAFQDFTRALELDRREPAAHHGRGLIHDLRGQYALAVADYGAALELDPTHVDLLALRAFARAAVEDIPGAIADLETYLALGGGPLLARADAEGVLEILRAAREG